MRRSSDDAVVLVSVFVVVVLLWLASLSAQYERRKVAEVEALIWPDESVSQPVYSGDR